MSETKRKTIYAVAVVLIALGLMGTLDNVIRALKATGLIEGNPRDHSQGILGPFVLGYGIYLIIKTRKKSKSGNSINRKPENRNKLREKWRDVKVYLDEK